MPAADDPDQLRRLIAMCQEVLGLVNDRATVERVTAYAEELEARLRAIHDDKELGTE